MDVELVNIPNRLKDRKNSKLNRNANKHTIWFSMWCVSKKKLYLKNLFTTQLEMYCVTMCLSVCGCGVRGVSEWASECRFGVLVIMFVALICLVVSKSNNKLLLRIFLDQNRPARQIPWFSTMLVVSVRKKTF